MFPPVSLVPGPRRPDRHAGGRAEEDLPARPGHNGAKGGRTGDGPAPVREQLLSRLSESVPVGLFELDMAGHVAFTNDRMPRHRRHLVPTWRR